MCATNTRFETGLDLTTTDPLGFRYGSDMFGPEPELRRLDSIRASLRDSSANGPDPVYAIVMDVGRPRHRAELERRGLLFGVVAYAAGRIGDEPVRSQGHVHKISRLSGWAAPEIFEIWQGRALIYMQERADDDPGRCIAVDARPGEHVIVPPAWAHAVISADSSQPLVFGAWCDRDYGFVYEGVRSHGGLAWFPKLDHASCIDWVHNDAYVHREIEVRRARPLAELGLEPGVPMYSCLDTNPDAIQWVSRPDLRSDNWQTFEP